MVTKRKQRMSENSKEKFVKQTMRTKERRQRDGCNFIIEDFNLQ